MILHRLVVAKMIIIIIKIIIIIIHTYSAVSTNCSKRCTIIR